MIVDISHLSFSFADKRVLSDLSFSVDEGDSFAILGANGVGKTTLIRLLGGVLQPAAGSIHIAGLPFNEHNRIAIQHVMGTMYPISGIYLKMTGYEYLMFIGSLYEMKPEDLHKRIEEVAQIFNFADELHRSIEKYSAGTKKKIEFCAAILAMPALLLLDEPFESVDPLVCYEIKAFIRDYIAQGGTLIISSHILGAIEDICTKFIIMNDCGIVDRGDIGAGTDLEKRYMDVVSYEEK